MRYQGGKGRLADLLAEQIERLAVLAGLREVEDRFCGGLAVALACRRRGLRVRAVEDGNPALIACYRAVAEGWEPPSRLSPADYYAIKARADAVDPMTAFALGFCSYGGIWGHGLMPDDMRPTHAGETCRFAAAKARKDLLAARPLLCETEIREGDCVGPCPGAVLYADVPYAGTVGYPGAPYWCPVVGWAILGMRADEGPVLVSEATHPGEDWRAVWAWKNPRRQLRAKGAEEYLFTRGVAVRLLLPEAEQ